MAAQESPIGVSVLCPSSVGTDVTQAERNRPDQFGTEKRTAVAESVRVMIRDGLTGPDGKSAATVADLTLDAIRRDRFWIITHASARATLEARFASILADLPDA